MKFVLVGNGFIGPKHQEAIKAVGGELVALAELDESKKIEGVPFFTDYKEAIKQGDAVVIATPNYLHTEMVLEAARMGKRIICEKPMTFRTHEIELMKGVPKLFGMFQLRHLPDLAEMRVAVKDATEVNLVVEMKRSRTYHDTWKGDPEKTGGLLVNIGSHYFDLLGHLLGYEPEESIVFRNSELEAGGLLTYKDKNATTKSGRRINHGAYWRISLTEEKPTYERSLTIDGKKFDLVQKENLHINVYKDFMWNHGVTASEEEKILKLINVIKS